MTTNSDGVQPNPGEQTPVDPNATAAAVTPAAGQTEPPVPDIDDDELKAAMAAAEAEKVAGGSDSSQQQPGQQPPAAQAQPTPQGGQQDQQPQPNGQQQQPSGDQPMIPKARLDEALARGAKAGEEAAYWRGVAEARGAGGQQQPGSPGAQQPPGAPQQQQQPTPQARLAEIHTKQDELAAKFDNGEITYAELTKQTRELGTAEQAIREELLVSKVKPADRPTDDGLYMETLTAQLEQAHPWCGVFNQLKGPEADAAWDYIARQAGLNLQQTGVDTSTSFGKFKLREEAAKLADTLGPTLIGNLAKAKGIAIPGQQPGQQQQQQPQQQPGQQASASPPLSPVAAVRAQKLDLHAGQPPNLNNMSGSTGEAGTLSEAALEAMSDDDIGNLPDAQRNRLLGIQ